VKAIREHPEDYCYGEDRAPAVAEKMIAACVAGTASIEGLAFRRTCKRIGVKHTRKDFLPFVQGLTG
jgi:hypothetical protein